MISVNDTAWPELLVGFIDLFDLQFLIRRCSFNRSSSFNKCSYSCSSDIVSLWASCWSFFHFLSFKNWAWYSLGSALILALRFVSPFFSCRHHALFSTVKMNVGYEFAFFYSYCITTILEPLYFLCIFLHLLGFVNYVFPHQLNLFPHYTVWQRCSYYVIDLFPWYFFMHFCYYFGPVPFLFPLQSGV